VHCALEAAAAARPFGSESSSALWEQQQRCALGAAGMAAAVQWEHLGTVVQQALSAEQRISRELCSCAAGRQEQQQSGTKHGRSSTTAAAAAAAAAALGPMPLLQRVVSTNTQAASKTTQFCVWLLYLTCCWCWCWTLHTTSQAAQGSHTWSGLPSGLQAAAFCSVHAACCMLYSCMQLYPVALAGCSSGWLGY
jgi:hypothetical protein